VQSLAWFGVLLGRVGGGLLFGEVFRGFYEIMSFVSLGASGRSCRFMNISLLPRFDSTRRRGPKTIHYNLDPTHNLTQPKT